MGLGRRLGPPTWALKADFNLLGGWSLLTKPKDRSPRESLLPHNEGGRVSILNQWCEAERQ